MADEPTKTPEEQEKRRVDQLTRIAAWTDPKPKPEPDERREEAEAS